jgi:class 3 adenylate cyclase/tetratricopeptide (TPR) repeat protein
VVVVIDHATEHATEHAVTRKRLDRLVPRVVLDWIADEPDRRWRIVEGTMVFADISGFTALSERLATRGRIGTEELVETLSRVFGGMLDITLGHGGQLLKFGGDALLLLFTGPDHARHAASAAVEMRRDLRRSAQIPTSVGKLKLAISIGAHSGAFHLMLVGDPAPQLVALGPHTTQAMEAESSAVAGEIVITPDTAEILGPGCAAPNADGHLVLKWRKAMIDPYPPPPPRDTDADAARKVTPDIMASALGSGAPDPLHRIATMAFFKFKGTDEMLEAEGPDAVAEALHSTLTIAQDVFAGEDIALLCVDVDSNGGKLFCSSGVPLTSEDDEGRMLRAARRLIDEGTPLPLRVGINRGHVFAGELGTPDQAMFSAMGDTVNTAARIMVTASPGVIHAHPAVLDNARTRYRTEPEGPFTFKGKSQAQVVYRVEDELGPREVVDRNDLPFFGRETELATLRTHVEALLEGRGGVVTVIGAAGLGKSRLIREALSDARDVHSISMHAEPYGAANSYRVVRDPLRAAFGVGHDDSVELADALRQTVQRAAPHLEPFLPLVGDALQLDVDMTPEAASIAPEFRAVRTADVVIELLGAVNNGPLVFVVEDMHWADDASAFLLARIAAATRDRPWLMFSARRDEVGGFATDVGSVVDLAPLPDDTVRKLAVEATEATPLRPHELDQVVERAAGSPLFVGELLAVLQELGSLDAVPASLQGTLAAQVDALDPLSRRVLCHASVLGRSFRRAVVDELLRHEGLELDAATVSQLSRFIEADGPHRYRFKNGLLADVVYDSLGYRMRAELHLLAGEAYEELSTDVAAEAATLSLHYSKAGDHERTYRYANLAAERAKRAYASVEASVHYERALDAARRLDEVSDDDRRRMWLELGDARRLTGHLAAALEAYRRAAAFVGDDWLAHADIHLRRARVRQRSGALRFALRESTRSLNLASKVVGPDGEVLQARSLAFGAIVRAEQQRFREAKRAALSALDAAERCGDHKSMAQVSLVLMAVSLEFGEPDAEQHALRALELYERLDDLSGISAAANNLGALAYFDGRWDDALERYGQSADVDRRPGYPAGAAMSEVNIGEVLLNQGKLDAAEEMLREAARVLRSSDSVQFATFCEMLIGRVLMVRGDLDRAERLLRAVREEMVAVGERASAYQASLHLADCLIRSGRAEEALAVISQASTEDPDVTSSCDAFRAAVSASALVELGSTDEALETIAEGVTTAREQDLDFDLARLLLLAGRIGPPFDTRLGTTEPVEQAHHLLDRLGVVGIQSL